MTTPSVKFSFPPTSADPSSKSPFEGSKILPSALPLPTYTPPDPTKKSHARKQPRGHVPRPRNAFILFRCDFVRQKKVPEDVENDHRNISRIAGRIWREMSDQEKAPWVEMAEQEKALHSQTYPTYRYAPHLPALNCRGRSEKRAAIRRERGGGNTPPEYSTGPSPSSSHSRSTSRFTFPAPARRSSSCPPPGSAPVSPTRELFGATPLFTRDDLARRPSRVVMYQSTSPHDSIFHQDPEPSLNEEAFGWARGLQYYPLTTGPYAIATPVDAPGWDAAPPAPFPWEEWNDLTDIRGLSESACVKPNMKAPELESRGMNATGLFEGPPEFTNPFAYLDNPATTDYNYFRGQVDAPECRQPHSLEDVFQNGGGRSVMIASGDRQRFHTTPAEASIPMVDPNDAFRRIPPHLASARLPIPLVDEHTKASYYASDGTLRCEQPENPNLIEGAFQKKPQFEYDSDDNITYESNALA